MLVQYEGRPAAQAGIHPLSFSMYHPSLFTSWPQRHTCRH